MNGLTNIGIKKLCIMGIVVMSTGTMTNLQLIIYKEIKNFRIEVYGFLENMFCSFCSGKAHIYLIQKNRHL